MQLFRYNTQQMSDNTAKLTPLKVVPHITDAIQDWIERVAKIPVDASGEAPDVCISTLL